MENVSETQATTRNDMQRIHCAFQQNSGRTVQILAINDTFTTVLALPRYMTYTTKGWKTMVMVSFVTLKGACSLCIHAVHVALYESESPIQSSILVDTVDVVFEDNDS